MISINKGAISGDVNPSIKASETQLSNAASILNNISIPSDFSQGSRLKSIAGRIRDLEREVGKIENIINEGIRRLETAEKNSMTVADSLNLSMLETGKSGLVASAGASDVSTNKTERWQEKNFLGFGKRVVGTNNVSPTNGK